MNYAPLHIIDGQALGWTRWFAWRPVRSEQGNWIWLRSTWRREFYPPLWFCPPAPYMWREYSDTKQNYWDSCEDPPALTTGKRGT